MARKTILICDICNSELFVHVRIVPYVALTTDDGEGRYLATAKIELCNECYEKILKAQPLQASAASGDITFSFSKNPPESDNIQRNALGEM